MKKPKIPDQVLRKMGFESRVQCDPQTRRMFLRTAGGALLAIPFLPSLLGRSLANATTSSPSPLRYIQIFSRNGGLTTSNWMGGNYPTGAFQLYPGAMAYRNLLSEGLDSGGNFSPVLTSAFAGLWSKMNVVLGGDIPWYMAHNRVAGVGASAKYVAGQNFPQDAEFSGGFSPMNYMEEYPSLDQVIGNYGPGGTGIYTNGLGGRRQFVNIGTDNSSCSWGRANYSDSSLPVQSIPTLGSPSGVFTYLFGTGTPVPPSFYASIVDQYWNAGKSLLGIVSSEDQTVLNEVFQLASQAQAGYTGPNLVSCGTQTQPSGTTLSNGNNWSGDATSANALADILTLALSCDMTRVVSIHLDQSFVSSITSDWHGASHEISTNLPASQSLLVPINQLISEQFVARLAQSLNKIYESGSSGPTVLDNSLIYWSSENRVPHDTLNMRCLLIGSGGGRMQTGYITDLRDKSRPSCPDNNMPPVTPPLPPPASQNQLPAGDIETIQQGDHYNRMFASIFYALGVPRTEYEMPHGFNSNGNAIGSNLGYGQIVQSSLAGWTYSPVSPVASDYNLNLIGEPWPFFTIDGTVWGTTVVSGSTT